MDIAKEVFLRKRPAFGRLRAAGFTAVNGRYVYSESFMDGSLTSLIVVNSDGSVLNSVIDSETGDEYLPLNIEVHNGSFVGKAREEYRALLEKIAEKCFDNVEFMSDQANRIAAEIERKYSAPPEHPFSGSDSAVFRNASSDKWFALVMCVERGKIDDPNKSCGSDGADVDVKTDTSQTGGSDGADMDIKTDTSQTGGELVDVMNVKIDQDMLDELLKKPGICRCYHMNKKYWVTLTMDDRLSDDQVMELVRRSFQLTMSGAASGRRSGSHERSDGAKRYWLIPSNPANFDVAKGFRDSGNDTLSWHHRINVLPGDIVYIYQTEPVASIMFECEVLESFLPRPQNWGRYAENSKYMMTLKRLRSFKKDEYPRSWLNEHGVKKTVRGQRSAPSELVEAISL